MADFYAEGNLIGCKSTKSNIPDYFTALSKQNEWPLADNFNFTLAVETYKLILPVLLPLIYKKKQLEA